MGRNYHVSRKAPGEWGVLGEGAKKVSAYAPTQSKAAGIAKNLVHNSGGGEVVIHGLNGKIRDKDTIPPGNDPYPPRDKRH